MFALLLLVTGLPVLFLGWFVGAVLLLWSPLWTVRQKVLGLLVFPGGYVITLGYLLLVGARTSSEACSGPDDGSGFVTCVSESSAITWNDTVLPTLLIAIAFVAPLIVAGHLYRAAGRRAATS